MKSKSAFWHRQIDGQAKSGMSIKSCCAASRISTETFQYSKRKLRPLPDQVVFEEVVRPGEVIGYRVVHLRFPSGVEMWLDGDHEAAFLRALAGC